jgi:large subunit ribosomal protein L17
MKKNVFGRQLKRDTNERKALFKGLMMQLVVHERIETTEQKAKAIRGQIEKLVTKAKKKGAAAVPQLLPYLAESATKKIIGEIAPRFANRPGGYTRMVRLGRRFNDDATMVVLEWVEKSSNLKVQSAKVSKKAIATSEVAATVATAKEEEVKKEKKPTKEKAVKEDKKKASAKSQKTKKTKEVK